MLIFEVLIKHCSEGVNLANMANCPFLENVPPQIGIICSAITQYQRYQKENIRETRQGTYKKYLRYCGVAKKKELVCGGHYLLAP